ncbi:Uma2 family endonuclease [Acidobacteria bacterium AH-259-A15]|nr:Uma2 family endonuclease [Acidobacteria bacterium AH-259-A15]
MGLAVPHHRFTVEDFYRMAEAGILSEEDRVELIEGEIVEMTPIGARHAGVVKRLNRMLQARLGSRLVISVQDPVRLSTNSEPQPDVAVLRPRDDDYMERHPDAQDVVLLIEVMESSRAYDRNIKIPLYASHAIREVWLVDLETDTVELFREPTQDGYASSKRFGSGGTIASEAIPELELAVDEIIG